MDGAYHSSMDASTVAGQQQRWQEWREQRDDQFGQPYGWLSLTALHWLEDEPTSLEDLPGLWWADDRGVHVDPAGAADPVLLEGEPVTEPTLLWNPADGEAPSVSHHERRLELILRDGFLAVRVRDPHSPGLRSYAGVPAFDYDPAWRLTGAYRPYADNQELVIGSAAARVSFSTQVTGEVDLLVGGEPSTLKVTGGDDGWLISFRDPGNSKFRWIVLDEEPAEELVVDFNFAANPPCAFSDFGTCPLPPAGNVLGVPVLAGERDPR